MRIILFIIALICAVFMALYLWKLIANLIKNIFIKKLKIRRTALIRKIFQIVLCFFTISILILSLINNLKMLQKAEQATRSSNPTNHTGEYSSEEYLGILENVYFDPEVINEGKIIWEHFIFQEIGLLYYNIWVEETGSFDELRAKYLDNIKNNPINPPADLSEIRKHIYDFYGTSFIPYTERSYDEVTAEIPSIDEAMNVSPTLYAEELYVRTLICKENSVEAIYQLGRSADNTFKQLAWLNLLDEKQMIYFGSIALACYQLSLDKNAKSFYPFFTMEDISLIYYRMAEIYIYLDKYCSFNQECSYYHKHFKLSAEAYLMRVQMEYNPMNEEIDLNEKFPYYDSYYASLLSDFINLYGAQEKGIEDDFREHAEKSVLVKSENNEASSGQNPQTPALPTN